MSQIHIGRGTTNLGVFEVEQIQKGLASGRFLLSDLGWKEGMEGWKPLSEFSELSEMSTHESVDEPLPDLAGAGVAEAAVSQAGGEGLPWDNRQQLGLMPAFVETLKLVLFQPGYAFTIMRQQGGMMEPLLFALIGGLIGGIAATLWFRVMMGSMTGWVAMMPPGSQAQMLDALKESAAFSAMLWIPLRVALAVFIGGGLLHICLMLVGGAHRPFETTFRVVAYCLGSIWILGVLPFGGLVGSVWGLIVEVIGLAKAHDTQTGRALTAALLPMIACCGFFIALGLFFSVAGGLKH